MWGQTVLNNNIIMLTVIRALAAGGGETVQHRGLGVFEVWESQDPLGRLLLARCRLSRVPEQPNDDRVTINAAGMVDVR